MRPDLFIYLAGPITAKGRYRVEDNVASALSVYLACLQFGIPAFCPQLSAAFPSCFTEIDYETWLAYDFAIIDRCTHLLMLPRWETSNGARRELAYAETHDKRVLYSLDELRSVAGLDVICAEESV